MGMDFVELMLEIEERYAVEIDKDDWVNMRTFGDLVDSVQRVIARSLDPPIEESRNEIILQSLLAELRSRLPKEVEIHEETRLSKLKPYVKRYDIWSFVQRRFPELPSWNNIGVRQSYYVDRPSCLGFLAVTVAWLIVYGITINYFEKTLGAILMAMVTCLGIAFAWLFWIVMRLPHRTIGDVAGAIAVKRQRLLMARELSSEDIENELRVLMSKAFALKPEKIQRESHLVKDLRLS